MHVRRSWLIAGATAALVAAGSVLTAGSLASGHRPAAAHRTATLAQRTFVSAESGNDANPCTRTAPCRNFAAAIAQTSSGGEVVVLDSGGYGTVTITQAVSIVAPPGVYAGISVFSGTGITINAGPSDVVTLRGLTLNGLGGTRGIDFNTGAELYVEDSVFRNLSNAGVHADIGTSARVVVEDSLFTHVGSPGSGVFVQTSAGTVSTTIDRCRFEDGFNGVLAGINSTVVVRDSVASGNSNAGFYAGERLNVENSLTTHNKIGLYAYFGGRMLVSETTIEDNITGVSADGQIDSFGNNRLAGNTSDGFFSTTIPLQ